jgi:hypothetical protein
MKYQKPELIDLTKRINARGQCAAGTSPGADDCHTGVSASVSCAEGLSAAVGCNQGNLAESACFIGSGGASL